MVVVDLLALYRPSAILARVRRALSFAARPRDALDLLVAAVGLGAVFGPLGFTTGLLHLHPRPWPVVFKTAAVALFAPALGEELTFRAALVPDRAEAATAWRAVLISTAVFTAWHGVETLWLRREASTFLRPDFLAWAAALGLVCAVLRRRSGAIWTAVILHWVAVVAWIGWCGGEPLF